MLHVLRVGRATVTWPVLQWPVAIFLAWLASLTAAAGAQETQNENEDLTSLDLATLMQMDVTINSVSKKDTRLLASPAAIAVVASEDLRRLGITTLPEALRTVAGMNVARITANEWAVSARGFNSEFATKLLVLIDGRTVYTPASAGVFWNAQDVVMEDVDRIEVIRGPGATLWGANAMNGIINVTTKQARDTHGLLVSSVLGTEDQPAVTARYGGQAHDNLHYRVYAKYFDREGLVTSTGAQAPDAWQSLRGGLRLDWEASSTDTFTIQGDYYDSDAGKRVNRIDLATATVTPLDATERNEGHNLLGRWRRSFSETSMATLQAYYDHVQQGDGFGLEYRDTVDVDLEHHFVLNARNDIGWGAGYRQASVENTPSFNLTWTPQTTHLRLFNTFVQDEIKLVPDRWHVTLGSKFEHNNLNGWAIQPSARLLWTPSRTEAVWVAWSRATRTPAIFNLHTRLNVATFRPGPAAPTFLVSLFGDPTLDSEKVVAHELGYRIELTPRLTLDLAVFYNEYKGIISAVPGATHFEASPAPPHLLISETWQNTTAGETHGTELSVQWQPSERLRLSGSYSRLDMHLHPDESFEDDSPQQQLQLRSYLDLPHDLELNGAVYYVDRIRPQSGGGRASIPSYIRMDLGMIWHPAASLEVGVWGQNLLKSRHGEYASQESTLLTEVPRSIVARVTWQVGSGRRGP